MKFITTLIFLLFCVSANAQILGVGNRGIFTTTTSGGVGPTGGITPSGASVLYETSCLSDSTAGCSLNVTTSGSTILVYSMSYPTESSATLADTGSYGTITLLSGYPYNWTDSNLTDFVWVITNAAIGTHNISTTFSSSPEGTVFDAVVVSGASPTSPVDSEVVGNQGSGYQLCNPTSNPVTTTSANEFVLIFGNTASSNPNMIQNAEISATLMMTLTPGTYEADNGAAYGYATVAGSYYPTIGLSQNTGGGTCDEVVLH